MLSPICLFTYNRLDETMQTVEALKSNLQASHSELYIFSDGPKNEKTKENVEKVRKYLGSVTGFKKVELIESSINKGLANSIVGGVTDIIFRFGKAIVLEDDLISTPYFLTFMNQALDYYEQDKKIQSVNGYSLALKHTNKKIYFQNRPFPWGWATWQDRWDPEIFNKEKLRIEISSRPQVLTKFKKKCGNDIVRMLLDSLNNRNDSWYVRWTFSHFLKGTFSAFPSNSYIQNIGHNDQRTHCKGINSYTAAPLASNVQIGDILSDFYPPSDKLIREFLKYFTTRHKIKVRLKLLPYKSGRKQIIEELKTKIGLL